MVIKHNISAKNAYRHLGNNSTEISSSLEKLSSGYKINRAADKGASPLGEWEMNRMWLFGWKTKPTTSVER